MEMNPESVKVFVSSANVRGVIILRTGLQNLIGYSTAILDPTVCQQILQQNWKAVLVF